MEREGWWRLSLGSGLMVIFLLGFPGRRKRLRVAFGLSLVCVLCIALGCGGGGGSSSGVGGGTGGGGGTPQATSVTLTTSNAKVPLTGGQLAVVATVTGGQNVSGTITFYDYGVAVAAPFPLTSGQPSIQIGTDYLWFIGVHQLTAKYNGDAHNLASTSVPLIQTITGTVPVSIQGATGSDVHSIQVTIGLQ